jgi:hypothetical protein
MKRQLDSMPLYMTFFFRISFYFFERRGYLNSFYVLEAFHFVVGVAAEYMAVDLCVSLCYSLKPAPVVFSVKLFGHG